MNRQQKIRKPLLRRHSLAGPRASQNREERTRPFLRFIMSLPWKQRSVSTPSIDSEGQSTSHHHDDPNEGAESTVRVVATVLQPHLYYKSIPVTMAMTVNDIIVRLVSKYAVVAEDKDPNSFYLMETHDRRQGSYSRVLSNSDPVAAILQRWEGEGSAGYFTLTRPPTSVKSEPIFSSSSSLFSTADRLPYPVFVEEGSSQLSSQSLSDLSSSANDSLPLPQKHSTPHHDIGNLVSPYSHGASRKPTRPKKGTGSLSRLQDTGVFSSFSTLYSRDSTPLSPTSPVIVDSPTHQYIVTGSASSVGHHSDDSCHGNEGGGSQFHFPSANPSSPTNVESNHDDNASVNNTSPVTEGLEQGLSGREREGECEEGGRGGREEREVTPGTARRQELKKKMETSIEGGLSVIMTQVVEEGRERERERETAMAGEIETGRERETCTPMAGESEREKEGETVMAGESDEEKERETVMAEESEREERETVMAEESDEEKERETVMAVESDEEKERETVMAEESDEEKERETVMAEESEREKERETVMAEESEREKERETVMAEESEREKERETVMAEESQREKERETVMAGESDEEKERETVMAGESEREKERETVMAEESEREKERETVMAEESEREKERETVMAGESEREKERETVMAEESDEEKERETVMAEESEREKERETVMAEESEREKERETVMAEESDEEKEGESAVAEERNEEVENGEGVDKKDPQPEVVTMVMTLESSPCPIGRVATARYPWKCESSLVVSPVRKTTTSFDQPRWVGGASQNLSDQFESAMNILDSFSADMEERFGTQPGTEQNGTETRGTESRNETRVGTESVNETRVGTESQNEMQITVQNGMETKITIQHGTETRGMESQNETLKSSDVETPPSKTSGKKKLDDPEKPVDLVSPRRRTKLMEQATKRFPFRRAHTFDVGSGHSHKGVESCHAKPDLSGHTHKGVEPDHAHKGAKPDLSGHTHKGAKPDLSGHTHKGAKPDLSGHTHKGAKPDLSGHTHKGAKPDLSGHTHKGAEPDLVSRARKERLMNAALASMRRRYSHSHHT